MVNQVLGNRYAIEELLGQGGMAQVYRARDQVLGRPVAIKILRPEYGHEAALIARFQREARAAANLVHPNIVAIYDVGQDGPHYYIVMEYIAGTTLKEIIRKRAPLDVEFALKVTEQVCAALEYAHRHGIIHRDIKPQNILLSEDEEVVKVADFGIAKSALDPESTADRLAMGTVKYISPEQARGVAVVPASDLYSLGVVLYEMLTGQQPFTGETPVSIALQHAEAAPIPPRQINPYLPPAVEGIVLRALAKDPRDRFTNAREMRQALERYRLVGAEVTGPIPQDIPLAPAAPVVSSPQQPRAVAAGLVEPPAPPMPRPSPLATPRRPARPVQEGGLGPLGVILLFLIAGGIVGLIVLGARAVPLLFPPGPTATPTATATPTPPPKVPVPDVRKMSRDEARATLEQKNLRYAESEKPLFDPNTPAGYVVSQVPMYGTLVEPGTVVTVTLGAPPGRARVPLVVGSLYEVARLTLEEAGFRVKREDVGCTTTREGYVHQQDPAANVQYLQGFTVTLFVSSGDQAVIPELKRVPLAEARKRAAEAGFAWGYENPQTREQVPNIDQLGLPGQVISYRVEINSQFWTDEQLPAGSKVPCGVKIHVAYYATTP